VNLTGNTCVLLRVGRDRSDYVPTSGLFGAEFEDNDDAHPPVLELTFPPVGGLPSGAGTAPVADTLS
jgi:hypothetical protein